MTFSSHNCHTSPHFKNLKILKFVDMTHFENALFTFDFHFGHLPTVSDGFFKNITEVHQYKTR